MADPRFFTKADALSLSEIAKISGAELYDTADGDHVVEDVASLDEATTTQISFLDNMKYKAQFQTTKAGACFVHPDYAPDAPGGVNLLVTKAPYKAYALTAQAFYPSDMPGAEVSAQAFVDDTAEIADGCVIEAGAVIKAGVKIGAGSWIESGAVIGRNVELGQNVRVGTNASVSHAVIDDHVRLYPGVRVGQDGFGFAIDPAGFVKVPQLGRVVIESHVEIGANTTIDRGAGPDTVIGQGTWIDNLVQIGHNVKVGRGCVIVSQVGISGSTVIEDFVMLGGQVGVAGHLTIGQGARLAAQSGVTKSVPAGAEYMGFPAQSSREYMKQVALLKRLGKKK